MNLSPRWCDELSRHGFSAVHWSTLGRADASDREIMQVAERDGFAVLTHDLDFGTILAISGLSSPSVIQLRAGDVSPEAAGEAVVQACRQCSTELMAGALLTVDAVRFRVSMLPLRNANEQ